MIFIHLITSAKHRYICNSQNYGYISIHPNIPIHQINLASFRFGYRISKLGLTLIPIIDAMLTWGEEHYELFVRKYT